MFHPVIDELNNRGIASVVLTLDEYYGAGAAVEASRRGLSSEILGRPGGPLDANRFYSRPAPLVWLDVLRSRPMLEEALDRLQPIRLVVGNDSSLIGKLLLVLAERRRIRRILVQDGRLTDKRPAPSGLMARALRLLRAMLSPLLRRIGLPYLAASEYGDGPVDVICANGPAAAALLRSRARRDVVVEITGQPRYDALWSRRTYRGPNSDRRIVWFTTPFEVDRLGSESQAAQERLISELCRAVDAVEGELLVKPHPREDVRRYESLLMPRCSAVTDAPAALLRRAWVAILGISSVIEEAALSGVPVLVPGAVIHGRRFDWRLPDLDAYPRFETADQVVEILRGLTDPKARSALVERQAALMLPELVHLPTKGRAAQAVAAVIMRA